MISFVGSIQPYLFLWNFHRINDYCKHNHYTQILEYLEKSSRTLEQSCIHLFDYFLYKKCQQSLWKEEDNQYANGSSFVSADVVQSVAQVHLTQNQRRRSILSENEQAYVFQP